MSRWKKIAIGISIGLNSLLIAFAITMMSGAANPYLLSFMADPNYLRLTSQHELFKIQPRDVVFLGDSITEGGRWEELFPGVSTRNRGIGGDTTSGVLERLEPIIAGRPHKVFIMVGTNDLMINRSVSEITTNAEKIVARIRAGSPDTRIYMQSVLPRDADYRDSIEALNAALRSKLAKDAHWIDLYSSFLDRADGSIRDELSNDELHLTGPGYRIWREKIDQFVQ